MPSKNGGFVSQKRIGAPLPLAMPPKSTAQDAVILGRDACRLGIAPRRSLKYRPPAQLCRSIRRHVSPFCLLPFIPAPTIPHPTTPCPAHLSISDTCQDPPPTRGFRG